MPTLLRERGFRFSFFSADCQERRHVHVRKDRNEAKYWLDPVSLERNARFSDNELRQIEDIIYDHLEELRKAWDDYCTD